VKKELFMHEIEKEELSIMDSESSCTKRPVFWRYIWPCGLGVAGGLALGESLSVAVIILVILLGLAPLFQKNELT